MLTAKLKQDIIDALRDAARYGAGDWGHLIKELERVQADCQNWPGCPCDSKRECMGGGT